MTKDALRELNLRIHRELFGAEPSTWYAGSLSGNIRVGFGGTRAEAEETCASAYGIANGLVVLADEIPEYSSTPEGAALVLAEIAKRGLGEQYAVELMRLTLPEEDADWGGLAVLGSDELFALLTAPPEQVCKAALSALDGAP